MDARGGTTYVPDAAHAGGLLRLQPVDGKGVGCAHLRGARSQPVGPAQKRLILKRKLSINGLELLAAAAAVVLVDKAGKAPRRQRYTLKCDNSTACVAANHGIAGSAALREALHIWRQVYGKRGTTVRLLYVETKAHSI